MSVTFLVFWRYVIRTFLMVAAFVLLFQAFHILEKYGVDHEFFSLYIEFLQSIFLRSGKCTNMF